MQRTSPIFILTDGANTWEVSHFKLCNWRFSDEYTLNLTILSPKQIPILASSLCLQVDGYYFHGILASYRETHVGNAHIVHLTMVSPLTHYLLKPHSRVYPEQSIEQVCRLLLQEAGLHEGHDFKLNISADVSKQWVQQTEKTLLAFFRRLLWMQNWSYYYEQTATGACCMISDTLAHQLPERNLSIAIYKSAGFHDDGQSMDADTQTALQPAQIMSGLYDADQAAIDTTIAHTTTNVGYGQWNLSGFCSDKIGQSLQKKLDETTALVHLSRSKLDTQPGQKIHLTGLPEMKAELWVSGVEICGNQPPVTGDAGDENDSMQAPRLRVSLELTPIFSGLPGVYTDMFKPFQLLHTARIEHRQGIYPDLSKTGSYHIRLHQDLPESSTANRFHLKSSAKAQASPWVRNALYFAGNYYGFSYPFDDGCDVLVAYENGCSQRPLILGTFMNEDNPTVINNNKRNENTLITKGNGGFLIQEDVYQKIMSLRQFDDQNNLTIFQAYDDAYVTFTTALGTMKIDAHQHLAVFTADSYYQSANQRQLIEAGRSAIVMSQEGDISFVGEEVISLRAKAGMGLYANDQLFYAKDAICYELSRSFEAEVKKRCSLTAMGGKQDWHVCRGNINLTGNYHLILKVGSSEIEFLPGQITLRTTSLLQLNATSGL